MTGEGGQPLHQWRRPSDGASIAYTDTPATAGGEGRPPVLLMHGWGCTHATVESLRRMCAEAGRRVIAVDLPGFGASPEPPEAWGTDGYARFMEDFCRGLGLGRPVLMGHSFGGRVAILMASRMAVDRIVLVDAAGVKPRRSLGWYARVYSYKAFKLLVRALLPADKARAAIERRAARRGSADYRSSSPRMRAVMSRAVNEDLCHVMPSIACPTLLIWGELDTATPLSDAKRMVSLIPDAGLVTLAGADHYSFLRNPAVTRAAIASFLQ